MKAYFLTATVALIAATAPASASIITVGGSFARSCYKAAEARVATDANLVICDRALTEQALDERDRLASHVNRGILRMVSGDLAGAQWDYDRAATLNPNEPEVWLNLGVLRYTEGKSDEAIRMFERAISLRTKEPAFAYYGRGLAHEDRGDFKSAYADYVRARSLKPNWKQPSVELQRYSVRRN